MFYIYQKKGEKREEKLLQVIGCKFSTSYLYQPKYQIENFDLKMNFLAMYIKKCHICNDQYICNKRYKHFKYCNKECIQLKAL